MQIEYDKQVTGTGGLSEGDRVVLDYESIRETADERIQSTAEVVMTLCAARRESILIVDPDDSDSRWRVVGSDLKMEQAEAGGHGQFPRTIGHRCRVYREDD